MRWTERQVAMLAEMGIRLPPQPAEQPPQPAPREEAKVVDSGVAAATETAVVDVPVAPASVPATPPAAIALPASGLDWPALRSAVAACTACALSGGRTQTVFGVGHPRAQWMIVGEAPGEQEDLLGEPFVGKSGQLLDNMLRSIGLSRVDNSAADDDDPSTRVYIANTVKCRPPGNRNPAPDELAKCEAFLIRQIELLQPKIILAMGAFAIHSLLRSDEPVGRLRGKVHRYNGVPLIATYHPAYLLRSPQDKARSWDDLCLAMETFKA